MPWIHDCLHLVSISVSFIWFSESSFTVITGPVSCSPMGEFVLMSHIFFHLNAAFFFFTLRHVERENEKYIRSNPTKLKPEQHFSAPGLSRIQWQITMKKSLHVRPL